jgi:hypothetical protein
VPFRPAPTRSCGRMVGSREEARCSSHSSFPRRSSRPRASAWPCCGGRLLDVLHRGLGQRLVLLTGERVRQDQLADLGSGWDRAPRGLAHVRRAGHRSEPVRRGACPGLATGCARDWQARSRGVGRWAERPDNGGHLARVSRRSFLAIPSSYWTTSTCLTRRRPPRRSPTP